MPLGARKVLLPLVAIVGLALALALVLALVLVLARPASRSSPGPAPSASAPGLEFDGAALPANTPARDFALTDQAGRRVALSSLRGQVTILAFVYSSCGAACVVLADQVRGALAELPGSVPVLFVSADPAADTPARVARFLARVSLSGRVRYLSGSAAALRAVWRAYRVAPAASGRAAFARSAAVLLLDRFGRERDIFGLEQLTPEGLAHDVRKLAQTGGEARG
jgi:protein SCO1/2